MVMAPMLVLLWAGMILGISCLEAWVKFRTPNLSKTVGVNIGRTVFSAFHKVQWALWIIAMGLSLFLKQPPFFTIISLAILLGLQTFWVFPYLSRDVDMLLKGEKPPRHYYHLYYAVLELVKLTLLLISAYQILEPLQYKLG